jgi:hypothetical protein
MLKGKAKEQNANDLAGAAENLKQPTPESSEAKKEEDELTSVLDQLNLSAVNNRVFSFSKESTKLMDEFTLILKDIVNGVPTAYDDLEKLLTRQESQLTKMFGAMPPFLQTLVKSLPAKFTATLGPEFLAATSGKPEADAKMMNAAGASASGGKTKKSRIPSLKSLVAQQGAVASMLRSILNFLKLRFPAFITGTNVLMSLAVFCKSPLQKISLIYANTRHSTPLRLLVLPQAWKRNTSRQSPLGGRRSFRSGQQRL